MLNVGQHVWVVNPLLYHNVPVSYTLGEYRVLSWDAKQAALLGVRQDPDQSILDLFSVRFIDINECYSDKEEAGQAETALNKAVDKTVLAVAVATWKEGNQ